MEKINEDVKEDEEDATILSTHADMKGWIRRRNLLNYKRYFALIFRGNLFLYERPDSDKPFLKFGLYKGKFIEKKSQSDYFDLEYEIKGKKKYEHLHALKHFDQWKRAFNDAAKFVPQPKTPPVEDKWTSDEGIVKAMRIGLEAP